MEPVPFFGYADRVNRITLLDIARRAGVSKATVARALANDQRAAPATRERIQALARDMGYRPDPALSAIAASRWRGATRPEHVTLAYLLGRPSARDPCLAPARERAAELGYHIDAFNTRERTSPAALERVLWSRGIRGILVGPIADPADPLLSGFDWSRFTAVCVGRGRAHPPLHTVNPDWFTLARSGWRELIDAGCRRPGALLLRHTPEAEDDIDREAGVRLELSRLPRARQIAPWIFETPPDAAALCAWTARNRVDGLLCFPPLPHGISDLPTRNIGGAALPRIRAVARHAVDLLADELRRGHLGAPARTKLLLV